MKVASNTTFFVWHYFSKGNNLLSKTKRVFHLCRKFGNKETLPTIVLGEFYALTRRKAGRDVAEKYFTELLKSGLTIRSMTVEIARQAGVLRCKYKERIPWATA